MKHMTGKALAYIREHGGKESDRKIGEVLGYSHATIAYYRKVLGIEAFNHRLDFKQQSFVMLHYRVDMTGKELADMFGMKTCTLNHYLKRLGLVNDKNRNKTKRRHDRNRTTPGGDPEAEG